jgi:hypothetical protein
MRRSKRLATRTDDYGPVPISFRFFDQGEWDTFNDLIRRELRAHGYVGEFSSPGEVTLPEQQITLGLVNLAQQCRQASDVDWAPIVAQHITRIPQIDEMPTSKDEALPALRVLLVPDDYLPSDIATLHAPYAESVIATVVADLPSSVRSIAPSDLVEWEISESDIWSRAWANTRRHPEPIDVVTVEIAGGPMTVAHGEHFYTASRVRWLEDLVGPVGPFGALVAMPRRSTILVHVIRDADVMNAVEPMVLNARLLHLEGPRSVSAHIYWWRDGELRWVPTFFDEADDSVEFHPPADLAQVLAFVA